MARPRLQKPRYKLWRAPNGVYHASWTENGRTNRASLGTRSESEAREELAAFAATMEAPSLPEAPTVKEALSTYVAHCEARGIAGAATARYNAMALARHIGWLELDKVRPSHGPIYAAARRNEGVSDGTIGREIDTLRAALAHVAGELAIPAPPRVSAPPRPPSRDRWLTREEAAKLLAACQSHHLRLFCEIALRTGARTSAILELTWHRVDLEARRIDYGQGSRTKRRAKVSINDPLFAVLIAARDVAETEHVIEFRGGPIRCIRQAFTRTARRAGFEDVTPHTLRHTAATWMAQDGVEMWQIALCLGHTSTAMVERTYAHYHPDFLQRAVKALG